MTDNTMANRKRTNQQTMIYKTIQKIKSDSHEMWKCVNPELEWQIRCFPYGEHSDVPRLQQVEQKAVGQQRNLGLVSRLVSHMFVDIQILSFD
jgi:hypothetical protein